MELVPEEQYVTKVLAASVTGKAPDFGWGTAGLRAKMAKDGVIVPLDDLDQAVGPRPRRLQRVLDQSSRYPKYDNQLFMVPMDLMSLQPEVNLDHVKEAGLDPAKFPEGRQDAARVGRGDDQARGRQGHPLGHHDDRLRRAADRDLGHRRGPDGLPARLGRPQDRGRQSRRPASRRWSGCSTCSTSTRSSTRDVTDRYKAFGTGQGSIFWTGPWTLNGYVQQKLQLRAPTCSPRSASEQLTYFEQGGLELYTQKDTGRYAATMDAVKWLSDNSFLWTTVGRGASPAEVDPGRARTTRRPACPGTVRGAFVDGMSFATAGRDPGPGRPRLHHLLGRQLPGQDAGGRLGRADASPRRRWRRSRRSGRRASTPAEAASAAVQPRPARRMPRASAPTHRAGRASSGRIDWSGYVFVAFFTVPFLLFNIAPIFFGIYLALHRVGHRRRARPGSGSPTSARRWPTTGCANAFVNTLATR